MPEPRGAGPAEHLETAAQSDVGVVRDHNEDSFLVTPADYDLDLLSRRGRLFVVADGMGGAMGGELASRLVVETIHDAYYGPGASPTPVALHDALVSANERVFQEATVRPDLRGMGSTCTALAVHGNRAWFAHVGDTRLYLVRDHKILQLTDDHSKVAQMVRDGFLTAEDAEVHPERNVLQRSIGPKATVQVDVSEQHVELRSGDALVLCSDGLTNHVRDVEILELTDKLAPSAAASDLIALAKDRGGSDNITVQVIRYGARAGGVRAAPATVRGMAPETAIFDGSEFQGTPRGPRPRVRKRGRRVWLRRLISVVVLIGVVGLSVWFWLDQRKELPSPAPGLDAKSGEVSPAEEEPAAPAVRDGVQAPGAHEPSPDTQTKMVSPGPGRYAKALDCLPKYVRGKAEGMCVSALNHVFAAAYPPGDSRAQSAITDLQKLVEAGFFEDVLADVAVLEDDYQVFVDLVRDIEALQVKHKLDPDGCPGTATMQALGFGVQALCPAVSSRGKAKTKKRKKKSPPPSSGSDGTPSPASTE